MKLDLTATYYDITIKDAIQAKDACLNGTTTKNEGTPEMQEHFPARASMAPYLRTEERFPQRKPFNASGSRTLAASGK